MGYWPTMPRTSSGSGRDRTRRLLAELRVVQPGEVPAPRDQLREGPLLDDAPVVEDEDRVRPPHRGEPVGDDEARAVRHELLERRHHEGLGCRVERRGGLV